MCGIVGYVGPRSAQEVLLRGLEHLEYRGYDSAGIAVVDQGEIQVSKAKGRLQKSPGTGWRRIRCMATWASVIPGGPPMGSPAI